MNKRIGVLVTVALLFALTAVITISGNKKLEQPSIEQQVLQSDTQRYILKDYNGRLAVFYETSDVPNEIFEIYTRSLPKEDGEKLKDGILIIGANELSKVLEDYTS